MTPCDQKLAGDATSDSGADVKTAVDWDARILNRSQGGDLVSADYAGYVDALRHGVVMVGGRANDMNPGLDDLTGDPRSMETFPGVVMVNSVDESGNLASTSDVVDGNVAVLSYGMNVLDPVNPLSNVYNIAGNGGTSTAAAVLSSYLALAMQKWPDATGNQIIQSLIRNTKSGKGKPVIDPERKRGFGEVDLNALLTVDPTQYKDVNPILEYQMKAAAQYPDLKDWYTQDCKTNPDGVGTAADNVPCEAGSSGGSTSVSRRRGRRWSSAVPMAAPTACNTPRRTPPMVRPITPRHRTGRPSPKETRRRAFRPACRCGCGA